jgi:hypothetical protein
MHFQAQMQGIGAGAKSRVAAFLQVEDYYGCRTYIMTRAL